MQVDRRSDGVSATGVRCSELPGGRVARATEAWARDGGHTFGGPSWEADGDWDDDSAKLRTEACFLPAAP